SRRQHTRFKCDWSSDVCSSDLFQSRENSKEPRRPRRRTQVVWRKRKGNPKSSLKLPEAKGAGHDPGNSVVLTFDLNEVAEHARVAAKPSLPQLVAQDDRVIASPLVLFGQEGSPRRRTHAQNLEKVTRDPGAYHALWRRAAAYCEILEIRRGHAVEGLVLTPPVKINGRCHGNSIRRIGIIFGPAADNAHH